MTDFTGYAEARKAVMEWEDSHAGHQILGATPAMLSQIAIEAYRKAVDDAHRELLADLGSDNPVSADRQRAQDIERAKRTEQQIRAIVRDELASAPIPPGADRPAAGTPSPPPAAGHSIPPGAAGLPELPFNYELE